VGGAVGLLAVLIGFSTRLTEEAFGFPANFQMMYGDPNYSMAVGPGLFAGFVAVVFADRGDLACRTRRCRGASGSVHPPRVPPDAPCQPRPGWRRTWWARRPCPNTSAAATTGRST
jgi:hypothetical protein